MYGPLLLFLALIFGGVFYVDRDQWVFLVVGVILFVAGLVVLVRRRRPSSGGRHW